jgi:hypothetical protein
VSVCVLFEGGVTFSRLRVFISTVSSLPLMCLAGPCKGQVSAHALQMCFAADARGEESERRPQRRATGRSSAHQPPRHLLNLRCWSRTPQRAKPCRYFHSAVPGRHPRGAWLHWSELSPYAAPRLGNTLHSRVDFGQTKVNADRSSVKQYVYPPDQISLRDVHTFCYLRTPAPGPPQEDR